MAISWGSGLSVASAMKSISILPIGGLDLTASVPDHSTFSKNRHGRFRQSYLFRKLFEDVLSRTIAEGLVGGEAFGIDASLIKADANREDGIEPKDWSPEDHASRATEEYLQTLDDAAFGSATPVPPKYISPVDPAAQWAGSSPSRPLFGTGTEAPLFRPTSFGRIYPVFSDAAIQFCLSIKVLFKLPLRQTAGMVASLLRLAGLDWPVPDYSKLCSRQKTLKVQIPYRRADGPLNLLVPSRDHAAYDPAG